MSTAGPQVPDNVKSIFGAMGGAVSNAAPQATGGFGDLWPKAGEYICVLEDLILEATTFKVGKVDTKIPMARVTCRFRTLVQEQPDGTTPPAISWRGRSFEIMTEEGLRQARNTPGVNTTILDMMERSYGRLRQHLGTFLRIDPNTVVEFGGPIQKVLDGLASNTIPSFELEVEERQEQPKQGDPPNKVYRTYRTEYVRPLASS